MKKKTNYENWDKSSLIKRIEMLEAFKGYGLIWEKDKVRESFDYFINWEADKTKEMFTPNLRDTFPVLKEIKNHEITTDQKKDYNLLLEGDNYHSLAVLNFTHPKSIDLIYIDPPYNTGNHDFKYNDQWVDREDGYRHSKWLSFMERRLKLAKYLLKNTGAIFISIDDNELGQLKMLCDKIFGETNLEAILSWRRRSNQPNDKAKMIAKVSEFILVYARNSSILKEKKDFHTLSLSDSRIEQYTNPDEDKRGAWTSKPWMAGRGQGGTSYKIKTPTGTVYDGVWMGAEETYLELLKDKRIVFPRNGDGKPRKKIFLSERQSEGQGAIDFWHGKEYGDNLAASAELERIFNGKRMFDNPKPTALIKTIIKIKTNKDSLILDFFAGTGTTGQAVLELNKDDDGERRFILCTNDEGNICTEVCYPRLEKVINGYKTKDGEKVNGLGGNLKYFKTDFVASAPTDKNKRKIVDKSTEMICLKENAFNLIKDKGAKYKIFKNSKTHVAIIFDPDSIKDFVEESKKLGGKINVYVFSLDDTVPEDEFKEIKNKVNICPIPDAILHVYRKVFKDD